MRWSPERRAAGSVWCVINDFAQDVGYAEAVVFSERTLAAVQLVQDDGERVHVSLLRAERRLDGGVVTAQQLGRAVQKS